MHEVSLTISELTGIVSVLIVVLTASISQFIWVKVKFTDLNIRVAELEVRHTKTEADVDETKQKLQTESVMLSREITNSGSRIYAKLDEVLKITTDIRIKCAGHFPTDILKNM